LISLYFLHPCWDVFRELKIYALSNLVLVPSSTVSNLPRLR
jgi:hypothetical protein